MILYNEIINRQVNISIIGLGYVGLPLSLSFAKKANVIGFDIDTKKIDNYNAGIGLSDYIELDELEDITISFSSDENRLKDAKFHIIAVPTPIYEDNSPNLEYVIEASTILGRNLKKGSIVVYESTVYPGVTENICIPILEGASKLKCGVDFKVGYSPERINPGDPVNKLESIVKIVSAIDEDALDIISSVYELIVKSGVYRAESIKIAEAAKVIENTQRDINIAFINEISIILNHLEIDTRSVLNAMDTKWNALGFKPGLVGGHCIGVDSYFLIHIAQSLGIKPETIIVGRKTNDLMAKYICKNTVSKLLESRKSIRNTNLAIFGFSFKENCPDIRNTKVIDLINELKNYGINIKVVDPIVNSKEVFNQYGINITDISEIQDMDAIIFAVSHEEFYKYSLDSIKFMYSKDVQPLLIDIKGLFDRTNAISLGYNYWSL
ncbi:nucleotide sugar dehydrogenase [Tissierella sp. MB52-C2]|uniref:nucleotide sugar dehydrogenase n=1 Tax=Tissierella sp. MB52-C2 TaxID=3070999 RepID=UPI00280AA880|nr:nucleotide sugar dehydrogenase [Tissierella sp. MB52-C2]WMM23280.1 nucleotide sugar dehydrogenase [Tissierella sp. MB52-C2]